MYLEGIQEIERARVANQVGIMVRNQQLSVHTREAGQPLEAEAAVVTEAVDHRKAEVVHRLHVAVHQVEAVHRLRAVQHRVEAVLLPHEVVPGLETLALVLEVGHPEEETKQIV